MEETLSHTRSRVCVLFFVVALCCSAKSSEARIHKPNNFHAFAILSQTDKVTSHHYEVLYDKYLQPIAGQDLRLLEGEEHFSQTVLL